MIWNAGHHHGRCADCGADLVRTAGRWWRLPHRHAIVWRPRREADVFGQPRRNPDMRRVFRRLPMRLAKTPPY